MTEDKSDIKMLYNPEMAEILRKLGKNAVWFMNNRDKLAEKFDEQYVAVYQGRVVDSDRDVRTLGERLRKSYPKNESDQIYVDFVTKKKYDIILAQMD